MNTGAAARRRWHRAAGLLLAALALAVLPGRVAAFFSQEEPEVFTPQPPKLLPAGTPAPAEDVLPALRQAMEGCAPRQVRAAELLYILRLDSFAGEPGFVQRLAGCFIEDQTDSQLAKAVSGAFGVDISAEELAVLLGGPSCPLVEAACAQLGNEGGETYWRWYGYSQRVEWCACFVSWCAEQCGYLQLGALPRFASCGPGAEWFQSRGLWLEGGAVPEPGMVVFFDWPGEDGPDGSPDHVGIVERAEAGQVYTIEGNAGDVCRRNCYAVDDAGIMGYGVPDWP